MSHFTVTVVLPGTLSEDQIEAELAKALAPFDENKDTPRYVKYTREGLIEKGRKEIEQYKGGYYADYLADPAAYAAKTSNLRHLLYLAGGDEKAAATPGVAERVKELRAEHVENLRKYRALPSRAKADELFAPDAGEAAPFPFEESFPAKLTWTDAQVHEHELRWYEPEDIGADGEVYSTYNPDAQWDWYSVGGRWAGYWSVHEKAADTPVESYDAVREFAQMSERIRPGSGSGDAEYLRERDARPGKWADVARKYDIDFSATGGEHGPATYAFLDSDGNWHEKGSMGWFGISSGDKAQEAWNEEYAKLIEAEADNAWFVLVDAHI